MSNPRTTPAEEIDRRASAAGDAFAAEQHERSFSDAAVLRAVADGIESARAQLRDVAHAETHLAEARLDGELTRTTGQLKAFAALVDSGEEIDAIIDTADATASPPRPDQRRMAVALGPVAVFAASNFPFAFSVAGGDTAAAWAAGCPVLLKAHPAHPSTSRLTAAVIDDAIAHVGAPTAWFSLVEGASPETGQALVEAGAVEAVAFTGSFRGGTTIARAAANRPRPIPAYCEMGSSNPVLITPAAAARRGAEIAEGLAASITGSAGQLCTKPGLVLLVDDPSGRALVEKLARRVAAVPAATMLYADLRQAFASALLAAAGDARVEPLVMGDVDGEAQPGALLSARADTLQSGDPLLDELFGPVSLVLWASGEDELEQDAARLLPGTLTATVHAEEDDPRAAALTRLLATRAGRLVLNGYPTGVTVGHATMHGGPFPATTSASHTSVGMTAVRRFLRPVAFQGFPDALLPPALQDSNPLGLVRRLDGTLTDAAVGGTGA